MSKLWTWMTFYIPGMWELDECMTKIMLKRFKRKYNKNKRK
tara:strand:+ start:955 stop:1077 length:123 start_codon:yes stop_codon:yes gene_type:complete